jgi:hypothetical protein
LIAARIFGRTEVCTSTYCAFHALRLIQFSWTQFSWTDWLNNCESVRVRLVAAINRVLKEMKKRCKDGKYSTPMRRKRISENSCRRIGLRS